MFSAAVKHILIVVVVYLEPGLCLRNAKCEGDGVGLVSHGALVHVVLVKLLLGHGQRIYISLLFPASYPTNNIREKIK
jgi:hypothetical protein